MLAFANVMHLFADKLSCLRAGRFSFLFILLCAFQSFLFGHNILLLRTSDAAPQTGDGVELLSNCDAVLLALIFFPGAISFNHPWSSPERFPLGSRRAKAQKNSKINKKSLHLEGFLTRVPAN